MLYFRKFKSNGARWTRASNFAHYTHRQCRDISLGMLLLLFSFVFNIMFLIATLSYFLWRRAMLSVNSICVCVFAW